MHQQQRGVITQATGLVVQHGLYQAPQAKEHPQQVSEGETAIEKKLGMNSQAEGTSQHDQNIPPQGEEAQTSPKGN